MRERRAVLSLLAVRLDIGRGRRHERVPPRRTKYDAHYGADDI